MKSNTAIAIVVLFLMSCEKDIEVPTSPTSTISPSSTGYMPMTPGSYWVYDWYVIDTLGNKTLATLRDSVYIVGDTVIGTSTYAVQEGSYFGGSVTRQFLRDSSGYVIDETGRIFFSETNYTDTLHIWSSTTGETTGYLKMNGIGDSVSVPAGTFSTLNAEFIVVNNIGSWPCVGTFDIHDHQYADNVGKVRSTFQLVSSPACTKYEQRLISYHIN